MPVRPPSRCTNPTCRALTTRPGRCRTCRQGAPSAHRPEWKWIYNDPRWAKLRDRVLSEEPVCACGCGEPPTVVDHITPHRGDEQLAFDRANLQAMTRPCHDRKTAEETLNAPARGKVTVILGPPCSGKTSTAHTLADPARDIVIDLDAIAQALTPHPAKAPHTSEPTTPARPPTLNRPPTHRAPRTNPPTKATPPATHGHPRHIVAFANEARDALVRRLARKHPARHVWFVTTRHADADAVPGARVMRLDIDAAECKRRATAANRPAKWHDLIDEWFIVDRTQTSPRHSR